MFRITKEFRFSAAHQIPNHPKCGRLHGHNYSVLVALDAVALEDGMVMDYAIMSDIVRQVVDPMDHKYLQPGPKYNPIIPADQQYLLGEGYEWSTAEVLAGMIFNTLRDRFGQRYRLAYVTVQEGDTTSATFFASTSDLERWHQS